jgi:uncharacterized protein (DUF427 family)
MKAIWNGKVVAESNDTTVIEGNHYFPKESLNKEYFLDTETQAVCHWKGTASYYSLKVDGKVNTDAAWFYPETSKMAKSIEGKVAFWKGVEIVNL